MNIPPQQELEDKLAKDLKHTLKLVPQSQRELFVYELARYLAPVISQTRTDTIREVEDQHQLDLAQSKLAIYKKVQKTLQAGQLPVVATVFDAEITQLEGEVAEREGRTE